jgi:hypothetical protein
MSFHAVATAVTGLMAGTSLPNQPLLLRQTSFPAAYVYQNKGLASIPQDSITTILAPIAGFMMTW